MTDLATRYGTRTPARRRLVVLGATLLAAVFLGWLVWVMLEHGRPLVQSDDVSFDVLDDHTATSTVTVVRRDADVEASCLVRAQASDHSVVGELNFVVGPGEPRTQTSTQTVRTERLATSVSIVGCVADGQAQRR